MFKLIRTSAELTSKVENFKKSQIAVMPTMGNLHSGHLSLVKKSISENIVTIVTIFVNPRQFGPNEDLDKYPRTLAQDL